MRSCREPEVPALGHTGRVAPVRTRGFFVDSRQESGREWDGQAVHNIVSGTVSGGVVQAGAIAFHRVDADQFVAGRDVHLHFRDGVYGTRAVIPGITNDECPYPGLAVFSPQQADWFFGRD